MPSGSVVSPRTTSVPARSSTSSSSCTARPNSDINFAINRLIELTFQPGHCSLNRSVLLVRVDL